MTKRRYDFDWLRTLVVINLIPFHVVWLMLFFPVPSQTGGDGIIATLLQAYMAEVAPWHMPLLFVIAGYSAAISLTRRSPNQYLVERLQRLVAPLVSYIIIIGPIMRYFWPGQNVPRGLTDFVLSFLPSH
ncbi:MAG: acyltransferase family protein, partial [Cyanobacteria bacterium J06636_28]